jgi:hypothetical protein
LSRYLDRVIIDDYIDISLVFFLNRINIKVYVSRLKIIHAIISEMGCDAVFSSSKSIVLY